MTNNILLVLESNNSYMMKALIESLSKYYDLQVLELKYNISFLERALFKITRWKYFIFTKSLENKILKQLLLKEYKFLFLTKQLHLKSDFYLKLKRLYPNIKIIGLTYDFLGNYKTSSINLVNSLKHYDTYFAPQKHYNDFIKSKACLNSYEINFSVSDSLYNLSEKLYSKNLELKYDVLVVANFEKERAMYVEHLLSKSIKVKIVGNNWHKAIMYPNIFKNYKNIQAMSIKKVISATIQSKITLGFLRKAELDKVTARTFEIPAFYGYMLHENNNVARDIYKDVDFVDFFDTKEDLSEKIITILNGYDYIKYKLKKEKAHKWIKDNDLLTSTDVNRMIKVLNHES
jgi:hypothetical protein